MNDIGKLTKSELQRTLAQFMREHASVRDTQRALLDGIVCRNKVELSLQDADDLRLVWRK